MTTTMLSRGRLLGRTAAISEALLEAEGPEIAAEAMGQVWEIVHTDPAGAFFDLLSLALGALSRHRGRGKGEFELMLAALAGAARDFTAGQLTEDEASEFMGAYQTQKQVLTAALANYIQVPGYSGPDRRKARNEGNLPMRAWLDKQLFLDQVGKAVNKMYGSHWLAFSMPDGTVYVQAVAVFETLRQLGKKRRQADMATIGNDGAARAALLTEAAEIFATDFDILVPGQLAPAAGHALYDVTMADGTVFSRCAYLPFRAEVFGEPATLEAAKYGRLKEVVAVAPHKAAP